MQTFLSRFSPNLMPHETLEAVFVQREDLAERLADLIRESALTDSKHHTLLAGPRGIGKTHLVSLIYHRVRAMDDLADKLAIAWLREEELGVDSLLDLLLRVLRALASDYEDGDLEERRQSLYGLPLGAMEKAAGEVLEDHVAGRTLLLMMENTDELFSGLGDGGQKRLRAYIQEHPFFTILATAPGPFNGVSLRTCPFYGFFRVQHLDQLSIEDATALLKRIATLEQDEELAEVVLTPMGRARIRTVHYLAGGNHRVYIIFSQFLTRESLDELVEPFMRMLDDLTPYYQERIRTLSPQQGRIIEFLCDEGHPVQVKQLAQRCLMTQQTASSHLKCLKEWGYVHSITVGRESFYELHEPLMRLCVEVKRHRGEPIRLFIDFLRLWYSQTELQQRLLSLRPEESVEREYVLHAIRAAQKDTEDPLVTACLRDYETSAQAEDFARALAIAEELVAVRGDAGDWARRGQCLIQLDRYDEALEACDRAIELDSCHEDAWFNWGVALFESGRTDDALAAFGRSVELAPSSPLARNNRGVALARLGRDEEALSAFDRAAELDSEDAALWNSRGWILTSLGRCEEALDSFGRAIQLDPGDGLSWDNRGIALSRLGRYEEALAAADKAIECGRTTWRAFFSRAEYLFSLERWQEADAAMEDALGRFDDEDDPETGDTMSVVRFLLIRTPGVEAWRRRIRMLIDLYREHGILTSLGQRLVRSITTLKSPTISNETAQTWLSVWQDVASGIRELQIPLRLLDVSVRYLATKDPRILLELPLEQRGLIEPFLADRRTD